MAASKTKRSEIKDRVRAGMEYPPRQLGISKDFDPTPDPIHLEVGRTLSQWESLEYLLSALFGTLCGAEGDAAQWAYGSVTTNRSRLDLLKSALRAQRDDKEIYDEIFVLIGFVEALSESRNAIAHGVVSQTTHSSSTSGGSDRTEDVSYSLVPPGYVSKKRMHTSELRKVFDQMDISRWLFGNYALSAKDIEYIRHSFGEVERLILVTKMRLGGYFDEQ